MGDVRVTRTTSEAAAKATGAHAFIQALPQGYDTPLEAGEAGAALSARSVEHTSELQSLMRNSYAVFCLKNKRKHEEAVHTMNNLVSHYAIPTCQPTPQLLRSAVRQRTRQKHSHHTP